MDTNEGARPPEAPDSIDTNAAAGPTSGAAGRYTEADRVSDAFNDEYGRIRRMVNSQTAGEGVFVKPFMRHMGRPSGPSRLPSRDAAVTDEVRKAIKDLMDRAPSIVEGADTGS